MPRTSIVVPIYNVEDYLLDCLESLAQQTMRDLEVIMVDDGSPDSSAEIAEQLAERDPRFRLVRQENGGLGHARNTGAKHASGEFLAFVDSDDVVLRHAYESLVGALDETGSDFATGNVHRLSPTGTRQSPMFASAFRSTRMATHVSRFPALLSNRTAWNKLWRRSFWDEHGFSWPEGVLYEDTALTVPAHVLARSVDVLAQPVYLWRIREGEERSITQRRLEPKSIRDRVLAVDTASRFLADAGEGELKRRYDEICASQDFRYTLDLLGEASEDFIALFLDLANDFFDRADPGVFAPLKAVDRLKYHFVRRRLVPELLEVLHFDRTRGPARVPVVRRRRRHYGDYPFRADGQLAVPPEVYRLERELALRTGVDDVRWDGDTLRLDGHAYIRLLDVPQASATRVRLWLEERGGAKRVLSLPVELTRRPDVTAAAGDGSHCYDWCGFRTSVRAQDLTPAGRGRASSWRLRAEVRTDGATRDAVVTATAPGRARRPEHRTLRGVRVVPVTEAGTFGILAGPASARVDTCLAEGEVVEVRGTLRGQNVDPATARLRASRTLGTSTVTWPASLTRQDDGSVAFLARLLATDLLGEVDVGDLAAHNEQRSGVVWELSLVPREGGAPVRLALPDHLAQPATAAGGHQVWVRPSRQGHLDLVERDIRAEVMHAAWSGTGGLELEGVCAEPSGAPGSLLLSAQDRTERYRFPMECEGERFRAALTPAAVTTLAGTRPLAEGVWDLLVQPAGTPEADAARVTADPALFGMLPLTSTTGAKELTLRDDDDGLVLDVTADLLLDERGPFHQHRLQRDDFPAFLRRPLRDCVLFEAYGGRQFADSPRAIYEELAGHDTGLEMLWTVDDGQVEIPDRLTPVRRWSRDWYEALARSRHVVTSTYRPLQRWVEKHPDQVVTQTWHGPPFKKIGFDSVRTARLAAVDYHDRLLRETSSWDHLLSPSPVATPILREAFRYTGELLETGYPRTDVFHREDRADVADRVRRVLGIPSGVKVVLYAPTFRDDLQYRGNEFRLDLRLDLDVVLAALGPDDVLLVRRHARVVDDVRAAGAEGRVRDVSLYPDVNELLLATDVLVSDYSSLVFDFANTGRPMVFFTYDLEDYRDRLRGFYFDVERLPGPLLRTSEEVAEALADPAAVRGRHDDAYREFIRDFCAFDDGQAAARVVQHVFGLGRPAR